MIAHFTKMAFKALFRFKLHSIISMLSLCIGFLCFISAILKPAIKILEVDKIKIAIEFHQKAHDYCFIANSVNFPVRVEPNITSE